MKFFRFDGGRIGVERAGIAYDVTEAAGVDLAAWPPTQAVSVIARFDELAKTMFDDSRTQRIDMSKVRLEVPVEWPNKLIAYPVNYKAHGEEMKSVNRADLNGFFLKANSSLSGPNDPIVLPKLPGRDIHHECELGVIIGKQGRHITRENALDHVFGYACLIDVVIRGKEERVMRKSYDTFCPLGPWITLRDEIPDPDSLQMHLWVNDELRQDANTSTLIVDVRDTIVLAASAATLYPGDIIATGTPAGVGSIKHGDTVRIAIDGLGEMVLPVRDEVR